MTLKFVDGFSHYATADLLRKWTAQTGTPTIVAGAGPNGEGVLRITSTTFNLSKTLPSAASWVLGWNFRVSAFAGGVATMLTLLDTGTIHISVRLNTDGTIHIVRGSATALTGGQSTLSIATNTWYRMELKVTIANAIAADSCKFRVNGVDWINVAAGQDTQNTANASANAFSLLGVSSGNTDITNLVVCDQSGSVNNDWLGDVRVETLRPTGAGTTTAWTPSAGANYAAVDDTTPTDDTDYVSSATAAQKDTYALGDLSSTPSSIKGVQTCLLIRKDDAGARTTVPVVRSGGTDYDGSNYTVLDSYSYDLQVRETDPATAAAWTAAGVNNLEAGVKLVS